MSTRTALICITIALALGGCAAFGDAVEKSTAEIGRGIDRYCELPLVDRARIRDRVNDQTSATVLVTCPGD